MISIAGVLRGGFLIVILLWYSVHVWHAMDEYFRDEFKKYLAKEYKQNKHLKEDVMSIQETREPKQTDNIESVMNILNNEEKILEKFSKSEQSKKIHIVNNEDRVLSTNKYKDFSKTNAETRTEISGKHNQQQRKYDVLIEEEEEEGYCSLSLDDKNDCD